MSFLATEARPGLQWLTLLRRVAIAQEPGGRVIMEATKDVTSIRRFALDVGIEKARWTA